MDSTVSSQPLVQFTFVKHEGRITQIATNHPAINHFLELIQLNRASNTWLNYAHDLKLFFRVIRKPPESVTRADCVTFMQHQAQAGWSIVLQSLLGLFAEGHLLDEGCLSHGTLLGKAGIDWPSSSRTST